MHWRRKWQPTPVFLPRESQGWGSLVGCHLWGRTESDATEATWQQQQQHTYIHWFVFFLDFFPHIGHCRVLSEVPSATEQVLASYLFCVW